MNIKVLLISSNSSARGGGERYLVYLTQGLKALDCQVHSLLCDTSCMDGWADTLIKEGAVVHRHRLKSLRERPFRFVQAMWDRRQQDDIARICRQIAPTAILVNQQYDEDGLDYLAGALKSKIAPVAGIMHMPMTGEKNQRPLGRWRGKLLQSWYASHPYCLIFVSSGSQREFHNYYQTLWSSHVVLNGCKFSDAVTAAANLLPDDWDDGLPVIGFSGQFVLQKNLQLLIEAWSYSWRKGLQSRLLLVGDGPERQSLEKTLASVAPPEYWHITGWQEHPERYLSKMDIFAMSSHFEGLPLSLIEAAGQGIPSVVTSFNGAEDVASKADWVRISSLSTAQCFGNLLVETAEHLVSLKDIAREGKSAFKEYFSPQRMAQDTLIVLDIL
jgi:glycosyltransferase involved in cell wall biosynthesis